MLRYLNFLWLLPIAGLVATAAEAKPSARPEITPAVQDYEPKPALWLLKDEDTEIYLFGTFHVLPPGFKWRSAALDRAIAAADELAVETAEEPGEAEDGDVLAMMMLDQPRPILERVPAERREALKAALESSELPAELYDSMRTWAAGMMMSMAHMLGSYGADHPDEAPGVEDVLEAAFREAGKPIVSVEEGDSVFAEMNALPEEKQVELLLAGLEELDEAAAAGAEDERNWATGNFEALALDDDEGFPPVLFELLVRKRNAAWTDWLVERLERPGRVLFAVGAAHLAGRESVQAMLERRGLPVTRVD